MLKNFKKHIDQHFSFLSNAKVLIAISGGIDSVVLTHLCYKIGLDITLAHCNFKLRGMESDADEDFVVNLAKVLNIPVYTQRFNTKIYARDTKSSIQMAARQLRYNWFLELVEQKQLNYILTAHHADDNLETFLINFIRGTGLEGLTGIPEKNANIIRPFLQFTSTEIEAYAIKNKIIWREDSSNASVKYMRNKLRHQLVPILKEINPNILQSFNLTLSNLRDTADIVEESTSAVLKRAITTMDNSHIAFKISEFKKVNNSKAYMFEVFKSFGFTEWHDIVNLLNSETGKFVVSKTHRLIKNRDQLLLSSIKNTDKIESIEIFKSDVEKETPLGILAFTKVKTFSKPTKNKIYVDGDTLIYPLKLRKKQDGDIFYPLGMQGKKKLSKYFKDEKLSLLDKENAWLLCSDNAIMWILSRRADERFKATATTSNIIEIKLISK